jgi:RNA polymerase sigma factor (sigma-70 family)
MEFYQHCQPASVPTSTTAFREALVQQSDQLFAAARPKLLRIAQAMGQAHAAEDIVQDTCLEAWRLLDRVTSLDRFDAWLGTICRHVCRRHMHAQQQDDSHALDVDWDADEILAEIGQSPDPFEEVTHAELVTLLDRALSSLSPETRTILTASYVAELPQQEVAQRLGITLKALETRLLRARKEVRQILYGTLRHDAEAFDLLPSAEPSFGWRESRIWCNHCGHTYLRGTFEPLPDGGINFRLRCPTCSSAMDVDYVDTAGYIPLNTLHTFRPALKRVIHFMHPYYLVGLSGGHHCTLCCGRFVRPFLAHAQALPFRAMPQHYYVTQLCPQCGESPISSALNVAAYGNPHIATFRDKHPRWIALPDTLAEYQGQPALQFRLADSTSTATCTYFAHAHTLQILAVFCE